MRFSALIPFVLCAAAMVLTFLCLFAGSSKGFMEDYALLTLNTSRIGEDIFNTSQSSSNPFIAFIDNVTNSIESDIQNTVSSFAKDLGVHDFYSVHLLDYCEGYFAPGPVPNAILSKSAIRKNVTACSNRTSMYNFDPREILQQELDNNGLGRINVTADLDWPEDVDTGLKALRVSFEAAFVLYCIAIGFIGILLVATAVSVFLEGKLSAFYSVVSGWLAFVILGIASALATAIAVKGSDVINRYGGRIGIGANYGARFLVITWVATGLMLVSSVAVCYDCVARRRQQGPKYGGGRI